MVSTPEKRCAGGAKEHGVDTSISADDQEVRILQGGPSLSPVSVTEIPKSLKRVSHWLSKATFTFT